jgi:hypothetical protein
LKIAVNEKGEIVLIEEGYHFSLFSLSIRPVKIICKEIGGCLVVFVIHNHFLKGVVKQKANPEGILSLKNSYHDVVS